MLALVMSYVSQLQVPKSHSVCSSSSSSPLSACPSLPPSSVPFSFLKPFHRSLRPRSLGSQSTACLDQHAALPLSLSPWSPHSLFCPTNTEAPQGWVSRCRFGALHQIYGGPGAAGLPCRPLKEWPSLVCRRDYSLFTVFKIVTFSSVVQDGVSWAGCSK